MPDLCAFHATILASRHLAHLDPEEMDRMRADYAQQCPDCAHRYVTEGKVQPVSRRYVTLTLAWGMDDDAEPERDSQLDTLVEHGDHYPTRPEMHIGFRHRGDDE